MDISGQREQTVHTLRAAGVAVREGVMFSELGSFQLGGLVGALVEVGSEEELLRVRKLLAESECPSVLIGEGSNVLFSDEGWPGIVVRYVSGVAEPVQISEDRWRVSAAMNLDALARWAVEQGRAGLEAFNGIPGTVGGAVVGNAGAWGVQMEHVLASVRVLDAKGELHERTVEACEFSYRDSRLKHEDVWVSSVDLTLTPGDKDALQAERERILFERAARHPDWKNEPCIGSFFRNLEPTSKAERRRAAGWFLESAGAKELQVGGAAVFAGHANIPVKRSGDCRAVDVAELARMMQAKVAETHGIDLVREVRYLGDFPNETAMPGFF
jgi:UDP-N-acetylmuramate dehydrogenase